jgi:hypothetical protein
MSIEYRLLPPPYTRFGQFLTRQQLEGKLAFAPGFLLTMRPDPQDAEADVEQEIARIRRVHPRATMLLHLDRLEPDGQVRIAAVGGGQAVRGFILGGQPDPQMLRRELAHPGVLATDIPRVLRLRGHPLGDLTRVFIKAICAHAHDLRNAGAIAARIPVSLKQLRAQLTETGLPAPGQFYHIIHMTFIAVAIQRSPVNGEPPIAYQFGYTDPAALRKRLADVLGYRPSDIRPILGWEVLLDSGLRRVSPATLVPTQAWAPRP